MRRGFGDTQSDHHQDGRERKGGGGGKDSRGDAGSCPGKRGKKTGKRPERYGPKKRYKSIGLQKEQNTQGSAEKRNCKKKKKRKKEP